MAFNPILTAEGCEVYEDIPSPHFSDLWEQMEKDGFTIEGQGCDGSMFVGIFEEEVASWRSENANVTVCNVVARTGIADEGGYAYMAIVFKQLDPPELIECYSIP